MVAYLVLFSYAASLLYFAPTSFESISPAFTHEKASYNLQLFRLVVGSYGALVDVLIVAYAGFFPFTSYTLTSWNLMVGRLLFAYLGQYSAIAQTIADGLRFPALVFNSCTVILWWTVFVPLIDYLLRTDPDERRRFRKLNISPLLINIHFLNLPIVAAEFLWTGQPLRGTDLWFGQLFGFLYLSFYLLVMDAAGFHYYIIMTPRTPWCCVSHGGVIGFYFVVYVAWNYVIDFYLS